MANKEENTTTQQGANSQEGNEIVSAAIKMSAKQKNRYTLEEVAQLCKNNPEIATIKDYQRREKCLLVYNGLLYYRIKDETNNQEYFAILGKRLDNKSDTQIRISLDI